MRLSVRNAYLFVLIFLFAAPSTLLSAGENKQLKADLDRLFSGKPVLSKIVFGGRATPRGYQADYPVNTLVYADTGQITFRVELGFMRTEVSAREMLRYFDKGTNFRISAIDLKDDRVEFKLESGSGDSARLKLMLGTGWQSKLDAAAVQTQMARVFALDSPAAPVSTTTAIAVGSSSTVPNTSGTNSTSNAYRRNPNATAIDGRISKDDFRTVLAGFDQELRAAPSTLSQDAAVLSRSLLAYQKAYGGYSDYASRPQLQAISRLQDRLGKDMQPQRDEDVVEMNEVFKRCVRVSQIGQTRDERGNLLGAGRNSAEFERLMLSDSAADVSRKVQNDVQVERAQRAIVNRARTALLEIENTLDNGDLIGANKLYQTLAANREAVALSPVQQYLQRTFAFRDDLATYLDAVQLGTRLDTSVAQQLQNLRREIDLLKASASRPLTSKYLQGRVQSDTESLREKLSALPVFQFEEANYRIPAKVADSNEKLSLITARITDLDSRLSAASDLRGIVTQPETIFLVEQLIGTGDAAALQRKGTQIEAAQRVRASLAAAQAETQQRVEALRAEAAAKAAGVITARQQFAEELMKRMSNEIWWCAGGKDGELLAGYITTSHLSHTTFSQITTSSPMWKELYGKGFRFSGVFDRDQTTKTTAITATGPVGAPMTAISDQDRAYLERAIDVLMRKANGVETSGSCIPATVPDSCPNGQIRQFMPSVGYICTSR